MCVALTPVNKALALSSSTSLLVIVVFLPTSRHRCRRSLVEPQRSMVCHHRPNPTSPLWSCNLTVANILLRTVVINLIH